VRRRVIVGCAPDIHVSLDLTHKTAVLTVSILLAIVVVVVEIIV
jgi:hypothetical protein